MRLRLRPSASGSSRQTAPSSDYRKRGWSRLQGTWIILQTVVNNIEITNNIDMPRPVRCRVMLTSPLETFSVGNTIVISRGLIDTIARRGQSSGDPFA